VANVLVNVEEGAADSGYLTVPQLRAQAAERFRCLCGNPFRPVDLDPAWLTWNGGCVRDLAAAIYRDRAFDRLPILADALEDAGCVNADLLTHLRGPGPHVLGCWALDLITGRGLLEG
jgi:hypothetical protein